MDSRKEVSADCFAKGSDLVSNGQESLAPQGVQQTLEENSQRQRWSVSDARAWYQDRPIPHGCNYVPSTAVNSTEMWQAATFDPLTIDRELEWAPEIGINSLRVFLQYLVWANDPAGQRERLDAFLTIAARRGLSTVVCLFDDCNFSGRQPSLGPQQEPVPGVHNSGWTASPGHDRVRNQSAWPDLERYVHDIVGNFAEDERILFWDLYNEPGNEQMGDVSLPLLEATFGWARAVLPRQPLTTAVWNSSLNRLNERTLDLSDIVTFHSYEDVETVHAHLTALQMHNRPILCSEWLRRTQGSTVATHLPLFATEGVGWYLWSLVNGRTQTHFPWFSPRGAPEPEVWFHDLLYVDGRPYDPKEIALLRQHGRDENLALPEFSAGPLGHAGFMVDVGE